MGKKRGSVSMETLILIAFVALFVIFLLLSYTDFGRVFSKHSIDASASRLANQLNRVTESGIDTEFKLDVDFPDSLDRIEYKNGELIFYAEGGDEDYLYQLKATLIGEIPKKGVVILEYFEDEHEGYICSYTIENREKCCIDFNCTFNDRDCTIGRFQDKDCDGILDWYDIDNDNDGVPDDFDYNSTNPAVGNDGWEDENSNGDNIPDWYDPPGYDEKYEDKDNDGITAQFDANDTDPNVGHEDENNNGMDDWQEIDIDNDGIPDWFDRDDDNDGVPDELDSHPQDDDVGGDTGWEDFDTDGDSLPDWYDNDDDGDGVIDEYDNDPLNNSVGNDNWDIINTDGDELPDWYDIDDDNDGVIDEFDSNPLNNKYGSTDENQNNIPDWIEQDFDGDELPDWYDNDDDDDGVIDDFDMDLYNPDVGSYTGWKYFDSNGDLSPDYANLDDYDQDGVQNEFDINPLNDTMGIGTGWETFDSEADGVYDYEDEDDDNDTLIDEEDPHPQNNTVPIIIQQPGTNRYYIDNCTDLSSPGTYILKNNITFSGTCFNITHDDIILNGQNFKITGNTSGYGVFSKNHQNLLIKNLIINFFDEGIVFRGVTDSVVSNNDIFSTIIGIRMDSDSKGNILSNSMVSSSFHGILLKSTNNNIILGMDLTSNSHGITLNISSENNTLENNEVYANLVNEIYDLSLEKNYLSYYNSKGRIDWAANVFLTDLTLKGDLTFPGRIKIGDEYVYYDASGVFGNFNSLTNITLYGIVSYSNPVVMKGASRCSNCDFISYSGTTFAFTAAQEGNYSLVEGPVVPAWGVINSLSNYIGNPTLKSHIVNMEVPVNITIFNKKFIESVGNFYLADNSLVGGVCDNSHTHEAGNTTCTQYNATQVNCSILFGPGFNYFDNPMTFYACIKIDETWKNSSAGYLEISSGSINFPPDTTNVVMNSSSGTNYTNEDLNCYAKITDPNNATVYANYTWYKNDVEYSSGRSGEFNNNTLTQIITIDSSETTVGEQWICSVLAYDGVNYDSDWINSSTIQVESIPIPNYVTINNVNHTPHNPTQSQQIQIDVNVSGIDNPFICNLTGDLGEQSKSDGPGDEMKVSFSIPSQAIGQYYYNITCYDSSSSDFILNNLVEVIALPDIYPSSIVYSNNTPLASQTIVITTTVNSDFNDSNNITVSFFDTNNFIESKIIPSIPADSQAEIGISYAFPSDGLRFIKIVTNPAKSINEDYYVNNNRTKSILIGDFGILGKIKVYSDVTPNPVDKGRSWSVSNGLAMYDFLGTPIGPVAGAKVTIFYEGDGTNPDREYITYTNGLGIFSYSGLPADNIEGNYTVNISVTDNSLTGINSTLLELEYDDNPSSIDNRPDFTISSISLNDGLTLVDELVTITATITNIGNVTSDATVHFYDGPTYIGEDSVSNLARLGGSQTVSTNYRFRSAGTHTVTVSADPLHLVDETSETNNNASSSFRIYRDEADLNPYSITVSKSEPLIDKNVIITGHIQNLEGHSASGILVYFYANDTFIGQDTAAFINPVGTTTASITYSFSQLGEYDLKIVANPLQTITETTYSNNNYTQADVVNVQAAYDSDLIISDILSSTMFADNEATITASVKNVDAGNVTGIVNVDIYFNSVLIGSESFENLRASETKQVSVRYNLTKLELGSNNLKASVNMGQVVEEIDYSNNNRTETHTVRMPNLIILTNNISFSNDNPVIHHPVTIFADITNLDNAIAKNITVNFNDTSQLLFIGKVNVTVPPLSSVQANIIWSDPEPTGSRIIAVKINTLYKDHESDSTNNFATRELTVLLTANYIPSIVAFAMNSTDSTRNDTYEDLKCYANITDSDTPILYVNYTWYRNGVANISGQKSGVNVNVTSLINTLPYSVTRPGEDWFCSLTAYDGVNYSLVQNTNTIRIEHFGCGLLDDQNKVFYLTQDIINVPGTCFTIAANNVTLDFAGYNIIGVGAGMGVYSNSYNNLNILNGDIFGFNKGISLLNSQNNLVRYMHAKNNLDGIYLQSVQGTTLNGNLIDSNSQSGLFLEATSQNNILLNNYIISNTGLEIKDSTPGLTNYLVYNNSEGEIKWFRSDFLQNLTLEGDLTYSLFYQEDSDNYDVRSAYIYLNYTKPPAATGAKWKVKHGTLNTYNVSIPTNCWNAYNHVLRLRFYSHSYAYPYSRSRPYCYDGTSWIAIGQLASTGYQFPSGGNSGYSNALDGDWVTYAGLRQSGFSSAWYNGASAGGYVIYEEGIWWNVSTSSNINVKHNLAQFNTTAFSVGLIDSSANIILKNTPGFGYLEPSISKNGVACAGDCYNFTPLMDNILIFNVSNGGIYNITESGGCGVYDVPGKVYTLTQDILGVSGPCFVIAANGITLNFNGHRITGDGTGEAVSATGFDDVKLINGKISNFSSAVLVTDGDDLIINNMSVENNTMYGFAIHRYTDVKLENSSSRYNQQTGILHGYINRSNIYNVISSNNGDDGLGISNSDNVVVNYFTAFDNTDDGIYNTIGDDISISNSLIYSNDYRGVYFFDSIQSSVLNSNVSDNMYHGIEIKNSNNIKLSMNDVNNNGNNIGDMGDGIHIESGTYFNIYNNLIERSYDEGMYISGLSASNITYNLISSSAATGVYGLNLANNLIGTNYITSNTDSGLFLGSVTQNNILLNNYIISNAGLEIKDSTPGLTNYLVYNNSEGEIKWFRDDFLQNLTLEGDLTYSLFYQEDPDNYNVRSAYIYLNYTKPPAATGAKWKVKHGTLNTYNVSIPTNCWNAYNHVLRLRFYSHSYAYPYSRSRPYCYDGTSWIAIGQLASTGYQFPSGGNSGYSNALDGDWVTYAGLRQSGFSSAWYNGASAGGYVIYEEGIWWNVSTSSNINVKHNLAQFNTIAFNVGLIDSSANITLRNTPGGSLVNQLISKDGPGECLDCHAYTSLDAATVIFNVTGGDSYEITGLVTSINISLSGEISSPDVVDYYVDLQVPVDMDVINIGSKTIGDYYLANSSFVTCNDAHDGEAINIFCIQGDTDTVNCDITLDGNFNTYYTPMAFYSCIKVNGEWLNSSAGYLEVNPQPGAYPKRLINLSLATPVSNYHVKVELNTGNFDYSHVRSDGGDIRFNDSSWTGLEYWVQDWNYNGDSIFWVKIPTSGTQSFYMTYGNSSLTSESNIGIFNSKGSESTSPGYFWYTGMQPDNTIGFRSAAYVFPTLGDSIFKTVQWRISAYSASTITLKLIDYETIYSTSGTLSIPSGTNYYNLELEAPLGARMGYYQVGTAQIVDPSIYVSYLSSQPQGNYGVGQDINPSLSSGNYGPTIKVWYRKYVVGQDPISTVEAEFY